MSSTEAPARARGARRLTPGILAQLFGRGREDELDLSTAVMLPIVGAMLADGIVEEEELFQIDAVCAFSPIFERNTSYENELLILRATKLVEDHGLATMCERAAALLSPALRETAFAYAVKVIFSDGRYGEVEQAVIRDIRKALDVSEARAAMVIDVISVMRRGADA